MAHSDLPQHIPVVDSEGVQATAQRIRETDTHVLLIVHDGSQVQVPVDMLEQQADCTYYLPMSLRALAAAAMTPQTRQDSRIVAILPVIAEEAQISTRRVQTGSVRIHKHVRTTEEQIDVPLVRDRVEVERVPVNRFLERPAEIHYRGDMLVIPVMEEVVVVEKRLRLREEIHVKSVREQVWHRESIPLQHEEVSMARMEAEPDETATQTASRNDGMEH
jgi:uncharacterized protein (TIGR02271 family)